MYIISIHIKYKYHLNILSSFVRIRGQVYPCFVEINICVGCKVLVFSHDGVLLILFLWRGFAGQIDEGFCCAADLMAFIFILFVRFYPDNPVAHLKLVNFVIYLWETQ